MKTILPSFIGCSLVVIILASCDPHDPYTISQCIITKDPTEIRYNGATLHGKIRCDGGFAITERGFYWGTSSSPETTGTKIAAGSGTGTFLATLSCLKPATTYYVKSYAVNSKGRFFGCEVVFTSGSLETFIDARDNQVYKIITIGNQTWMAENLNFSTPQNSYCYDDQPANCSTYGRLYTYSESLLVAPDGWHLPSDAEFQTLIGHFSSQEEAYAQLIVGGCSGYNAKFAGIRNHVSSSLYFGLGVYADFWTSTGNVFDLNTTDQRAFVAGDNAARGFSVRCIKNDLSQN